jgi:pimeloyl-ACP methyl ester carboxylesterase
MDGTGEFFKLLVNALDNRLKPRIVSYPSDEPIAYEELLELVTSCFPKEKPFFILGESFSGPLAIMAAAKRPLNLKGLILVATFVKSPMPPWVSGLKLLLNSPLVDLRPRRLLINIGLGRNCPPETRKWIHEKLPRLKKEVLASRVEAVLDVNVREELKKTDVPVVYMAASKDWVVPRRCLDAVWICRPDVEVKVIDGPHAILQCRPQESAVVIRGFCNRYLSAECSVQSPEVV